MPHHASVNAERRYRIAVAILVVCIAVLVANQVASIAEYGVRGWLEGEGRRQTEWEVRASIGAISLLLALLVTLVWRAGEGVLGRWRDARLLRAIRRHRREEGR